MATPGINNGQIYELISQVRLESKADTVRLETKVDVLQEQVNKQQITISVTAFKLAIIGFIASSVIGAIVSVVALRLIK